MTTKCFSYRLKAKIFITEGNSPPLEAGVVVPMRLQTTLPCGHPPKEGNCSTTTNKCCPSGS
ncbi:MAG: hypothetical protein LBT29_03415 [Flavobacteriaceae bacterium]|nr:hypothetical protein [Flavobacteriaceae bacterium]